MRTNLLTQQPDGAYIIELVDNGSATYKTNITLGTNNFGVTAIDLTGNPSVWNKTILVDEDSLPDWYPLRRQR